MADYLVQDTTMTSIANAIRSKTGKTAKMTPATMATEISGISTGVELNFNVVGGTSAPSSPSENTIWVNTNTTITSWVFSATQPTGSEGKVWIKVDTSSNAEFNALKENGIQVYPMAAYQYVSGAWVAKTAKTYQSGAWVEWITYLFNEGDTCDDITGGWSNSGYSYSGTVDGSSYTYTKVSPTIGDTIKVSVGAELKVSIAGTAKMIDLTDVKTVAVDVESVVGQAFVNVTTSKALGSNYAVQKVLTASSAGTTVNLDVSSLSGSYYVAVFTYGSTNVTTRSAVITKVWLKK